MGVMIPRCNDCIHRKIPKDEGPCVKCLRDNDLLAENSRLRAALSEAVASLDLSTSDCILMALASRRALAKFKDSDDDPCRWCGSDEDIHEDHCPAHVLVDIGFVGLIGDEVMRRSMEDFVEEENRKRREREQNI